MTTFNLCTCNEPHPEEDSPMQDEERQTLLETAAAMILQALTPPGHILTCPSLPAHANATARAVLQTLADSVLEAINNASEKTLALNTLTAALEARGLTREAAQEQALNEVLKDAGIEPSPNWQAGELITKTPAGIVHLRITEPESMLLDRYQTAPDTTKTALVFYLIDARGKEKNHPDADYRNNPANAGVNWSPIDAIIAAKNAMKEGLTPEDVSNLTQGKHPGKQSHPYGLLPAPQG